MLRNTLKPIILGSVSFLGLLSFYAATMRLLAGSWQAVYSQFQSLWYYMLPLAIGFGIQVGLYTDIKQINQNKGSGALMAGNTTTSTIGMVACCAHHLTEILPIIGLSALSTLLINYQIPILIIGIASNIFGIIYLLRLKRKT